MRKIIYAAAAAATVAAPSVAAPWILSANLRGELGYGTNPFLVTGVNDAAGFGSFSIAPTLSQKTSRSTTTVSGSFYREQYFNNYGHSDTGVVQVSREQQLTSRLQGSLQGNFTDTDNALLSPGYDPTLVDVLTTGQHTRIYSGAAGLTWQESARDQFGASFNAAHGSYGNQTGLLVASDYDQYGGTLSYYHTFTARTQAGFIGTYSRVTSNIYPDSWSLQPAVALKQVLSDIWLFNGDIGVIRTHINGGGNSTGVGFHANLCGTYPRRTICITASRQTSASGIGGLRTDLTGEVNVTQKIGDKQSITLSALYDDSRARGTAPIGSGFLNLPRQKFAQARLDYSRDLTPRLSAGATARFQHRDYSTFGRATAVGGSVNLTYRIGHIQ
ncbi:TonB-dependent receptor [Sphingomonas nostoxanthinifaciens]|uniref:hypothetical protein n=1 Tax=Sphingomonas nostoxanthinifaciens TaxID=2872652 RepID=UPI001CC1F020|nr:hypothetical protein [Sphingomonas nostoxanthinifaciens]UAK24141.1 hypothetical protein K8P63_17715 [Sphingomonas nostoxanthinifaciens]